MPDQKKYRRGFADTIRAQKGPDEWSLKVGPVTRVSQLDIKKKKQQ